MNNDVDLVRDKIDAGKTLFNAWLTLGVSLAVELAADAGADLVTIDQQHGIGDNSEMVACLTAARAANVPALVRVAANDFGLIGRALDAGAQGVICPMLNTVEEAARFVGAVKYPPIGARSTGAYRARFMLPDYFQGANAWTISCGQIETRAGMDNLDAILATPGLDMICAGPNDLAISLSNGQHTNIHAVEVTEALDLLLAKCREHGVIAGIFANDDAFARAAVQKGWQVVAVSTDARWLSNGAFRAKQAVNGE